MRNLLLFILVLVGIWWLRRALNRAAGDDSRSSGSKSQASDEPEAMLGCARCGLHVPQSEGVRDGDAFYCCDEHRRLGARR